MARPSPKKPFSKFQLTTASLKRLDESDRRKRNTRLRNTQKTKRKK